MVIMKIKKQTALKSVASSKFENKINQIEQNKVDVHSLRENHKKFTKKATN